MFHTNLVIVPHNFERIPFVVHPSNRVADASPDDVHARIQTNDCYTDRFAAHQGFAVDVLAALDVDFVLADAANALVVASTSVEFVDLKPNFDIELKSTDISSVFNEQTFFDQKIIKKLNISHLLRG